MAKSRNNLLGVGGQRNKLPRNGRPASAPGGPADNRPAALDQKQELLRKMRERTAGASAEAPGAEEEEATTQEAGGNA
ncbi:DUF6243 family protein [Streptomyces sp. BBFR102]|uniref:DUF6243 family protein n=1 Tax=Streptomyces sp. BBFR102 TaxID=3448171 RepID=UPI003F533C4D